MTISTNPMDSHGTNMNLQTCSGSRIPIDVKIQIHQTYSTYRSTLRSQDSWRSLDIPKISATFPSVFPPKSAPSHPPSDPRHPRSHSPAGRRRSWGRHRRRPSQRPTNRWSPHRRPWDSSRGCSAPRMVTWWRYMELWDNWGNMMMKNDVEILNKRMFC